MQKEQRGARVCTIRDYLGIAGPTVSVTLDGLEKMGYIIRKEYGMVDLTPEGRKIARKLYEKEVFFRRFLIAMGMRKEIAERDAMAVKNVLSDESYERLREFAKEWELIYHNNKDIQGGRNRVPHRWKQTPAGNAQLS